MAKECMYHGNRKGWVEFNYAGLDVKNVEKGEIK